MRFSNWTRVVCNKPNSKFQSGDRRGWVLWKFGLTEWTDIMVCRHVQNVGHDLLITPHCRYLLICDDPYTRVSYGPVYLNRIRFSVLQPIAISVRFVPITAMRNVHVRQFCEYFVETFVFPPDEFGGFHVLPETFAFEPSVVVKRVDATCISYIWEG